VQGVRADSYTMPLVTPATLVTQDTLPSILHAHTHTTEGRRTAVGDPSLRAVDNLHGRSIHRLVLAKNRSASERAHLFFVVNGKISPDDRQAQRARYVCSLVPHTHTHTHSISQFIDELVFYRDSAEPRVP